MAAIMAERGRTLIDLDRPGEALDAFNKQSLPIPRGSTCCTTARSHSSGSAAQTKRSPAASACCFDPDHVRAHASRGNALLQLKRHEDALAAYARALALDPHSAETLCNRGTALRYLKRYDDALASYDAALARDARSPKRGPTAARVAGPASLRRSDGVARPCARAAPDHATNWLNRGNLHFETARARTMRLPYDRAIALHPTRRSAFRTCVVVSDRRRFRARLASTNGGCATHARHYRPFTQRAWRGDTPLDGRTVLIHAEQGFGDTLQFCRYVPLVAERGARVVFEVQPQLRALMASLPARPT